MTSINPIREAQINRRLEAIHDRLRRIAEIEANAAPLGGMAADGRFEPERSRLIAETDRLLDELAAIGGSPAYRQGC